MVLAGVIELFGETAIFEEGVCLGFELTIQEGGRYVDEDQDGVGGDLGVGGGGLCGRDGRYGLYGRYGLS